MIESIGLLVAGLVVLTVSADRLVVAAARISRRSGVPSLLIGALIIGVGTSVPELVVSLIAAEPDKALGNVIGSNISNLTLVLGAAAMVAPIRTHLSVIGREGILMLSAVLLLAGLLADGKIDRADASILLIGLVVAVFLIVHWSSRSLVAAELDEELEHFAATTTSPMVAEAFVGLVAMFATVTGAWLLVRGAEGVADELDLTGAFVGLVILAVGTSLPELATSVAAVRRGESDLAVGNVLGSNVFNSLAIGGTVGLVHPGSTSDGFGAVVILMVMAAVTGGAFATTDRKIQRWEGAVLLFGFALLVVLAP
ncbi:MAG: calcium/sodium antiporter [Acidimicrobiia bacterium]|nr:calcium/sodium antiporter [Acidimicrobiia bacterium]